MKSVTVIGAGYVGLTVAVCLADDGHIVRCVDTDSGRVEMLRSGTSPIHEPGVEELIISGMRRGLLSFSDDPRDAVPGSDIVMLCVPTPQGDDGSCDLSYVHTAIMSIRASLDSGAVVVLKSTMPIGGADLVSEWLDRADVSVVSNPEFLRQGFAVHDFMSPDRVVIGASDYETARPVVALYDHIGCPVIVTDRMSAETIKYVSNAYLAMRVSYVNAVSVLCDHVGAAIDEVMLAMGMDHRIGSEFLHPSLGWGGSCFPKDIASLQSTSRDNGYEFALLDAVVQVNDEQIERVASSIIGSASTDVVAVWGLAFKAGTDDLRGSPAVRVIDLLLDAGLTVRAYDPRIRSVDRDVVMCDSAVDACDGASVLAVMTGEYEYRLIDPEMVSAVMTDHVMVDGCNSLDRQDWMSAGFQCRSIGHLR